MKQHPASPVEDARVGLAGPIWGLGATMAAYGVFLLTEWPSWAAIARVGAWINLFNLLPIPPLDGGRAFRAMGTSGRWICAAALAVMWFHTAEGLLVLLLLTAIIRALGKAADTSDRTSIVQYAGLVILFSLMSTIEVPVPSRDLRPDGLNPMPVGMKMQSQLKL